MITTKKALFAQEYLIDLNATKAAERAGYSVATAKSQGQRLMTDVHVKARIAEMQKERSVRTAITQDRVLQELARIAFFDPRQLFNADGSPKPINELDDDTAAVLSGMDITEEYEGVGADRKFTGYTKKIKLADKVAALALAMRHLGMLNDKLQLSGSITVTVKDYTGRKERVASA